MRAFFALELPPAAQRALGAARDALRAAVPEAPVRWAGDEGWHLTLRFLGELEDPAPVLEAAAPVCAGAPALELRLGVLGSFGGRQPRVVWAGVRGEGLAELAAGLEQAARQAGFPPEGRSFRAHVTLGRVRRGRGGRALRALAEAIEASKPPAADPFPVREVVLFESRLERGRPPVYVPVSRLQLSGGPGL